METPARLLDLTRLVSRVGHGAMTGIDRVEAAYLRHLLAGPDPLFALVRTALGFVLLDRPGLAALQARLSDQTDWGVPDLLSRLTHRNAPMRRRAESDLRRLAIARAGRKGLGLMLSRHLPKGAVWLNVGHTNLAPGVFDAVHAAGGRAVVLLHDMIPLDYPQYQRPGSVEVFERRMRAVSQGADLVIYNSAVSQQDGERYFDKWGRVPKGIVAHLGIDIPTPDQSALPAGLHLAPPYFVALGTIEPRKNHALLLDVWAELAREGPPPTLFILGNRGWNNDAVFARLNARPPGVVELNNLNDGAIAALLQGARALLFPSHAEGFGLPPCEAHALGTQVVASDLPVIHEVLGNIPIYASPVDMYSWRKTIQALTAETEARQSSGSTAEPSATLPTWDDHFNRVLRVS